MMINNTNNCIMFSLHSAILFMECGLFGAFVITVLYEQMVSIYNDQTTVERTIYEHSIPFHRNIFSCFHRLPTMFKSTSNLNIRSV